MLGIIIVNSLTRTVYVGGKRECRGTAGSERERKKKGMIVNYNQRRDAADRKEMEIFSPRESSGEGI